MAEVGKARRGEQLSAPYGIKRVSEANALPAFHPSQQLSQSGHRPLTTTAAKG